MGEMTEEEITREAARIWGRRGGEAHRDSQTPAQRAAHAQLGAQAREEYKALRQAGREGEVAELRAARKRATNRRAAAARRMRRKMARREGNGK
jgi:hypothetical protein